MFVVSKKTLLFVNSFLFDRVTKLDPLDMSIFNG